MNQSSTDASNSNRFAASFEGRVDIVDLDGHLAVVAQGLGRLLSYADDGKQLVGLIAKEWSDEFIAGGDVIVIRGERLAEFKRACKTLGLDLVEKRAPSLMLLTMSGVQLVLARSEKPEGRAFRRWLVSEFIPAFERGKRLDAAPATDAPPLAGDAPAAGGSAGGGAPKPPRRPRRVGARPAPGPAMAIPVNARETAEERLAAARLRGLEHPPPASPDELLRGQVLRMVRGDGARADVLAILTRAIGPAPDVRRPHAAWEGRITQAVWMVRRADVATLLVARDEVARAIFCRDQRNPTMVATLVGLISTELLTLPESMLLDVLSAVPRWRSGEARPIPLPVSG